MKKAACMFLTIIALSYFCAAVPAAEPSAGFDERNPNVKYGEVQLFKYFSSVSETERAANVILPPNYTPEKKWPVLYLLHGIGGNEYEWFGGAPVEVSANLFASQKAQEAIIVIPNIRVRHKSVVKEPGFFSLEHFKEFDAFIDDLKTSLRPAIEKKFSVQSDRNHQAIAGLSMGGREALYVGLNLCDQFAYIGAFEPAPGLLPYDAEAGLFTKETLRVPEEYNDRTYVFVVKGTTDGVVGMWPEEYARTLEKNGTNPHYTILEGGHEFKVWKESLYLFLPKLFREDSLKETKE